MVGENGAWTRQGEAFWRAHHEAWKRSDLNQRQYCEAEGIPLKAFGNWRAIFKAETPRSRTSFTASSLNSRLNFRLCMATSGSMKHPISVSIKRQQHNNPRRLCEWPFA